MDKELTHYTEEEIAHMADAMQSKTFMELPEDLREHLYHCDLCAEEVMMVSLLAKSLPFQTVIKDKTTLPAKLLIISSIAASALIILILMIMPPPFSRKKTAEITNNKDTTANNRIDDGNEELTPNNDLEKLVDIYRGQHHSAAITVITSNVIYFPDNLFLTWVDPDQQLLTLEIRNNQDQLVSSQVTADGSARIPDLSPGIYYWKLVSQENNILFVGKIISQ